MTQRYLSLYVENDSGILAKISGLFAGKAYNLETITAGTTDDPSVTRITICLKSNDETFEQIKKQLAVVSPKETQGTMDVTGRSIISGLPRTEHIEAAEISEAIEEPVSAIVEAVHSVLERTPPELASDIYENGITLTGSGALLGGLSERIESSLRLPCRLAEDPGDCVVRGTGMALENMEMYGDLVYDYRKPIRYDFRR